jgi:hypothetical protein
MVQVFVQMADYLKTEKKRPLKEFAKHPVVLTFNKKFHEYRTHRLLYRIGFNEAQREKIMKSQELYEAFDKEFTYFERAKISGDKTKVPDGVNHPALFNMRALLKFLPEFYSTHGLEKNLSDEEFFKTMLSSFAKARDTQMRTKHQGHIQNFLRLYKALIEKAASPNQRPQALLKKLYERSRKINTENRITGNALIQIVFEIMAQSKKGMTSTECQKVIDQLINSYQGLPEVPVSRFFEKKPKLIVKPDLFSKILEHVENYREDI